MNQWKCYSLVGVSGIGSCNVCNWCSIGLSVSWGLYNITHTYQYWLPPSQPLPATFRPFFAKIILYSGLFLHIFNLDLVLASVSVLVKSLV